MNCLVMVTMANKTLSQQGCASVAILTLEEFDKMHKQMKLDDVLIDKNNQLVHDFFWKEKIVNRDYLSRIIELLHDEVMNRIYQLGNPSDIIGDTIAHVMAYEGFKFSMDEIIKLGNPMGYKGNTIAHWMAYKGHKFTIDEVLKLGNPINDRCDTLTRLMIDNGYRFSDGEIEKLNNSGYDY